MGGTGTSMEPPPPSYPLLSARSAPQPPRHRQTQPQEAQVAAAAPRRCQTPGRLDGECGMGTEGHPPASPLRCQGVRRCFSFPFLPPVPWHRQPAAELQVRPPPRQTPDRAALLSTPPAPHGPCPPRGAPRPPRSPPAEGRGVSVPYPAGRLCPIKVPMDCASCVPCCAVLALPGLLFLAGCPRRLRDGGRLVTQRWEATFPADAGQRCQGVIVPPLIEAKVVPGP